MTRFSERKTRCQAITGSRSFRGKPLVIDVTSEYLGIRERYAHYGFLISWSTIFWLATESGNSARPHIAAERPRQRRLDFQEA